MDSPDHLPRERPVLRSLPATVLAALLVAHCSFVGDDHAALLAQELERRHSGHVDRVVYEPANFLDPPLFLVRLRQGITIKRPWMSSADQSSPPSRLVQAGSGPVRPALKPGSANSR